jgi:hypothetical protein
MEQGSGIVYMGDLGPRVTDAALRDAFAQVRVRARSVVSCVP